MIYKANLCKYIRSKSSTAIASYRKDNIFFIFQHNNIFILICTYDLPVNKYKKMYFTETKMLRWLCSVTKDLIMNDFIRGDMRVARIAEKISQRLTWLG